MVAFLGTTLGQTRFDQLVQVEACRIRMQGNAFGDVPHAHRFIRRAQHIQYPAPRLADGGRCRVGQRLLSHASYFSRIE